MKVGSFILAVSVCIAAARCAAQTRTPLQGWVDLHTHPLSNLGFGGKLLYGGPDITGTQPGALLPEDPDCNPNVRAASIQQALGHDGSTHGPWRPFGNSCGDSTRALIIHFLQSMNNAADIGTDTTGFPDFSAWPVWNDITHQKMWVEWIRRAFDSGLHVMVALAVNNKTLGDAVAKSCDLPTDDKTSADLQIAEIKRFVDNSDFMEIALTSSDLDRIVGTDHKLAVVLGVEVDNIGNFNQLPGPPTETQIRAEIDRLYNDDGVRYIFPVHLLDNKFGHTATYDDIFNYSTFREDGAYWDLTCSNPLDPPQEQISYRFEPLINTTHPWVNQAAMSFVNIVTKQKLNTVFAPTPTYPVCGTTISAGGPAFDFAPLRLPAAQASSPIPFDALHVYIKANPDPALTSMTTSDQLVLSLTFNDGSLFGPMTLTPSLDRVESLFSGPMQKFGTITVPAALAKKIIKTISLTLQSANPASKLTIDDMAVTDTLQSNAEMLLGRRAQGMQNRQGLTKEGKIALNEMMKLGMLIDIDHMSDASKTDTFGLNVQGGYPLNSGHSGLRGFFPSGSIRNGVNERLTTASQYATISKLHGMAGVGGPYDAFQWSEMYQQVITAMTSASNPSPAAGFGTDTDGLAVGMPPRCNPRIQPDNPVPICDSSVKVPPDNLSGTPPTATFQYDPDSCTGPNCFKISRLGTQTWDYRKFGVAHFGMLADFLKDVQAEPVAGSNTVKTVNNGAEYFYQTWLLCEQRKSSVPPNFP
jgi:hypothetical protein